MNRKEAIASDLKACKRAFDAANIPWCITDGTVLGYARYNDIMAWDTDVDVGVFVEITEVQWEALYIALRANGFGNLPGSGLFFSADKEDFICGHRKVEFNLWFFYRNGDYFESFPSTTPGLKFVEKAIWYDQRKIVDFLGSQYPMPINMDDYLCRRYGEDWKTNIVKDHGKHFIDRRGGTDQSTWTKGRMSKNGDLWPKILKIEEDSKEELEWKV